jgi:hypothetical protein
MANTAFDHNASITVPSSGTTVNNAVITWNGTTGKSFNNTALVIIDAGAVTGVTSLVVDDITINGTSITTITGDNNINITPNGTGSVVLSKVDINAGAIDGTAIGAASASTAVVTSITAPTAVLTNSTNSNAITLNTGATAANYTITMPTAAPAAGKVLKTTSGSTSQLEWGDAGGSQTPWTGNIDAGNYTLSNVGVAGNSWTANAILMRHSVSGGQISISAYNESNTTNSTAKLRARTGGSSAGDPYMEFEISGGNGQFLMGVDNSASDYFVLGGQGSALGGNDTFRVTSGTPPVLSLNTGLGSNFDYVCSNCGNHGLEMFTCCGEVEWHDDVLALRKAGVDLATMANPYAIGQSLNIAHLVKLGIMDYDDKEEDPVALANRKTPWLGINISNGLMFTWAGMWQTRERMDNQYQELKNTIQELKAEVAALKG